MFSAEHVDRLLESCKLGFKRRNEGLKTDRSFLENGESGPQLNFRSLAGSGDQTTARIKEDAYDSILLHLL
jgi:hypothetical protein